MSRVFETNSQTVLLQELKDEECATKITIKKQADQEILNFNNLSDWSQFKKGSK